MTYLRGGSILHVDLTSGKVENWPSERYADLIGGRGVNAKILYDMVGPDIGALDPANVLVFANGPLSGTFVPGSGRTEITSKSPMTGHLGMASMGGYFAAELKHAGYDHLVVTGRAEKPCYLYILDDHVEIRDASNVWGKDTYDTPGIIRRELKEPDAQVISIGQAGENLVRYACIMGKVGDAAAKTGLGAVMGSKRLKAVAVRGTKGVKLADPERFFALCQKAHHEMRLESSYESFRKKGTPGSMDEMPPTGLSVAGNYTTTGWEEADEAAGVPYIEKHNPKRAGCFGCPLRCMEQFSVPGIGNGVVSCAGYIQTTFQIKNSDMDMWWESVVQAQKYGLDLMSFTGMLGWAMEMYEKGVISEKDTDGIPMNWGTREATMTMMEKIVKREGFGDLLADNVFEATARLGRDSEQYMMHIKGLHMYPVNQMNFRAEALAGAIGPRGDRIRATTLPVTGGAAKAEYFSKNEEERQERVKPLLEMVEKYGAGPEAIDFLSYEGKAAMVRGFEETIVIPDLLGLCKWHGDFEGSAMTAELDAELYEAGSGKPMSAETLLNTARRVRTLERAYDCREGLTRESDTLPKRFFTTPMPGKFPDDVIDREKFEKMKDEYYALKGWDLSTGVPSRQTLESYGFMEVADELERLGKLPVAVPEPVAISR